MIEFLQGLLACVIAAMFTMTAIMCILCGLSGRHAASERAAEDRREYFQQGDLARRRQTWRARG